MISMSKPLYIFVTPFFPSETRWRGAYGYDYVKALQATGEYEVVVVMPGSEDYEYQGIKVYGFKMRSNPSYICNFIWNGWNVRSFLHKASEIGIDWNRVEIVHGYTNAQALYGVAAKKLNPKIKVLAHHHDCASFGVSIGRLRHFYPIKFINYFSAKRLHEQVDVQVYISEKVMDSFERFPDTSWSVYEDYRRISKGLSWAKPVMVKDSYVLHNGVDTSVFRHKELKEHKDFVIGCVGNFETLKDQAGLIKAVGKLATTNFTSFTNLRVVFVGSGPRLDECKAIAKQKESTYHSSTSTLNFNFLSEVKHEELADFYRSLDLFVLPSYFEGFGCVFTESWACGTPFIACKGIGIEDMILDDERNLWLCEPKNPDDLAVKIGYYIEHRPIQHMKSEIDEFKLVKEFVAWLKSR